MSILKRFEDEMGRAVLNEFSFGGKKIYSVTTGGKLRAVAKPIGMGRGYYRMTAMGFSWINPQARDISMLRDDGYKPPDGYSAYAKTPHEMLMKGVGNVRRELQALAKQLNTGKGE